MWVLLHDLDSWPLLVNLGRVDLVRPKNADLVQEEGTVLDFGEAELLTVKETFEEVMQMVRRRGG
jgi:hypothetical protein